MTNGNAVVTLFGNPHPVKNEHRGGSLSRLGHCLSKLFLDVFVLSSTLSDESFEVFLFDIYHAGDSRDRFVVPRSDEPRKYCAPHCHVVSQFGHEEPSALVAKHAWDSLRNPAASP
jgi:hypothetical protein